jgi:hypothetical protein
MTTRIHTKHGKPGHILFLFCFAVLCYWPLTFFLFGAKNDNITQFLPVRFHVSEALRHGHLPLWSPYMYLGYPIHGDMQGGAWNPVVWLLSLFGRYTIVSIHFEIFMYIFLSGLGMYRLLSCRPLSPITKLAGSLAYMSCGYITDVAGSNLPFLAAAAYLPFLFAYYYELLTAPGWRPSLKSAVALSLTFVSAYPSFFIMGCYIMLAALFVYIFRNRKEFHRSRWKKLVSYQLVFVLFFLCLSAVAILSYLQILPFYGRNAGVSLTAAMENSFHPYSSISFLFPAAAIKDGSISSDLIIRNSYFNSLLLCCFLGIGWIKKTSFHFFVLTGVVFFFLFALGDHLPVRGWCYKLLPLMDTFRHPSNARLLLILGTIVLGSTVLETTLKDVQLQKKVIRIAALCLLVVAGFVVFSLPSFDISRLAIPVSSGANLRTELKTFIDNMTYHPWVLVNGLFQIGFLVFFIYALKKKRPLWMFGAVAINSLLFAQFAIPYTAVQKASPLHANALLRQVEKGYPAPDKNVTIGDNSSASVQHLKEIGIYSFYNKNIATSTIIFTPTYMSMIDSAFRHSTFKTEVLNHPYAYCIPHGHSSFALREMWNNGFVFDVRSDSAASFHLQQLQLPGWKAYMDGHKSSLQPGVFLSVVLPKGTHELKFLYRPRGINVAFFLSLAAFLVIFLLLLKKRPVE